MGEPAKTAYPGGCEQVAEQLQTLQPVFFRALSLARRLPQAGAEGVVFTEVDRRILEDMLDTVNKVPALARKALGVT